MSTLREIKSHIASVSSIAQVTRALELVSTTKHHRLQLRVDSTRAFAEKSWEVLNHLTSAAEDTVRASPLFCGRSPVRRIGMLLITSDRGMVGAYHDNVIALATHTLRARALPAELVTLGKVGREAMLRAGYAIHADFKLDDRADITDLTSVARVLLDGFAGPDASTGGSFDEVLIAYTQFFSGARLQPTIRQLLPVCPHPGDSGNLREYLYEPKPEELLRALLPRLIRFQVYQAFLESLAAENASRMVAMHAATQNAGSLIANLRLGYNKARQQAITAEIMDIMGGSNALVGRGSLEGREDAR